MAGPNLTAYRGNDEARALSAALSASGGWTPCNGLDPERIDPVLCASCPVRTECGDYGRAVRGSGTFGGARLIQGREPRC
jgi:hypothetical protein